MINENYVNELLKKVLTQIENGKIEIGEEENSKWIYYVELENSKSDKVNLGKLSLLIKNSTVLCENLKEYLLIAEKFYANDKYYFQLNRESFHEKLILDLIINATNFNINNFEKYVKERTQMLNGDSLDLDEMVVGKYLDSDIIIKSTKNISNLEGPYKFSILFDDNLDKFKLPSVTYGKIGDELYIYCLQGEKEKQTNHLAKKMDRHFRKANKDVDMEDEILSQVSVSALVSLTIFLAYQKELGVKKVVAYNFMPLRYSSNLAAGFNRAKNEESKVEFEELHNRNQFNITNKFFNTLIRYAHHFNLNYEYDDLKEELHFNLKTTNKNSENIIFDIENACFNTVFDKNFNF